MVFAFFASTSVLFNLSFIPRLSRIIRWLYSVFIQFALFFFLVFSFPCYFFLTFLKIEIRFHHLVAPFEKIFFMNFGPPLIKGHSRVLRNAQVTPALYPDAGTMYTPMMEERKDASCEGEDRTQFY
jgi:uncharacterized protein with PQ loop repeat